MHNIMRQQAGTRYIGAMTNGKYTITSHYKTRDEFLERLSEKNTDATTWGDPLFIDVSPTK